MRNGHGQVTNGGLISLSSTSSHSAVTRGGSKTRTTTQGEHDGREQERAGAMEDHPHEIRLRPGCPLSVQPERGRGRRGGSS